MPGSLQACVEICGKNIKKIKEEKKIQRKGCFFEEAGFQTTPPRNERKVSGGNRDPQRSRESGCGLGDES